MEFWALVGIGVERMTMLPRLLNTSCREDGVGGMYGDFTIDELPSLSVKLRTTVRLGDALGRMAGEEVTDDARRVERLALPPEPHANQGAPGCLDDAPTSSDPDSSDPAGHTSWHVILM